MDTAARWADLVNRPEEELPLDEAALLISATAHPGLDVGAQLDRLDRLAGRVKRRDAAEVGRVLFDDLGLQGDREDYENPVNSFLDQVLDRRRGIPISLSVLLIEVGRRAGVALDPVGMPGHFLVRDPERPEELIDAFSSGRRLDRAECERLFASVAGPPARLSPEMLAPVPRRAVLARMLANLDRGYERRGDRRSLGWVCALRLQLPGGPVGDRIQLSARLASLGRLDVAAGVLEAAAAVVDAERVKERLAQEAVSLRARLN